MEDFETLKEQLALEQPKKRVDPEGRKQFLDSWEDFKKTSDLADKLDGYESVFQTTVIGKNLGFWEERPFVREKSQFEHSKDRKYGKPNEDGENLDLQQ